jgi:transcriptional regulator with XRE-family HTH domain
MMKKSKAKICSQEFGDTMTTMGKEIKFNRIKKRMTQEELASGIISVSYLSKIENNQLNPSEETLRLLLERLKIEKNAVSYEEFKKSLESFHTCLLNRNKEEAEKLYKQINQANWIDRANHEDKILFKLFSSSYFILLDDIEKTEKLFSDLHKERHSFSNECAYFHTKYKGDLHYLKQESVEASKEYERCIQMMPIVSISEEEKADCHYAIGLTYSWIRKNALSIDHTLNALTYYQSNYQLKKCTDCQVLLGISYIRLSRYDQALSALKTAWDLAEMIQYNEIKGVIEQNLGYFFLRKKDLSHAIEHFSLAVQYRIEGNDKEKIHSVYSLMKAYYNNSDLEKAKKWLNKGWDWIEREREDHIYHLLFQVFRYLILGVDHEFENLMKTKVIPYFVKSSDLYNLSYFSRILAEYYYKNRKYKLAADWFEKAFEYNNELIHL